MKILIADDELMEKIKPFLNEVFEPNNFHRLSEYVRLLSESYHEDLKYKKESMDYFMRIILYGLIDIKSYLVLHVGRI